MDADELKRRTKLFALRILKWRLLYQIRLKVERSGANWFVREHPLVLTTARRVVPDLELNFCEDRSR